MVSLTRVFLILNSLGALLHRVTDFMTMTGKLKVLFDVGQSILSAKDTIEGTIKNIAVNQEPIRNFEQLKQVITRANCGRFTMTGDNGSGKSTALLLLQKALAGKSFLLPTHYTDLIWRSHTHALSTGQRVMILIQEMATIKKIQYLLLDEWDANLDAANTKAIDRKIDEISKTAVVIEVRHLG